MKPITSLEQTSLNWDAELVPLYYPNTEGKFIRATDRSAVIRSDYGNVLGVVSDSYQIFQNSELFDKVRPLAEEGLVNISNVGFLQNGKLVYVQAQMSNDYSAVGESYRGFITLTNQHTGRARAGLGFSVVRIVCENTFAMATKDLSRFSHIGEGREEFLNSTFIVDYVNEKVQEYVKDVEILAGFPLRPSQFDQFLVELYQKDEISDVRNVEKLNELFYNGTETEGKTAYDAFNAITEFNSNFSRKNATDRFNYVNFGQGAKVNKDAMRILFEVATS
jgi:phage/plasmid-like protein (TIGR03299 family)